MPLYFLTQKQKKKMTRNQFYHNLYIALAKDWSNYEDLLMKHIQEQADKMAQIAPFDEDKRMVEKPDPISTNMAELLNRKLVDCNLSVRSLFCLKAADIETIGQLVKYKSTELLQLRNFGKRSLIELEDFLVSIGLHLGMNAKEVDIYLK